ncbi:Death-associated inhibitor of apoptosis 2 [Gryllus bimaculatus]|nr:Death-associated inhibitor of apoptosis 2 [Gryllus bimaculatus]
MNQEQSRLNTFQSWPANAEVEPQRIAKAGFFYTGIGLEVECFSCGRRISEWNYGDQVMARHRLLNPECPFVKDPITSGNIPVVYRSPSLYSQVSETNQNSLPSPSLANSVDFLSSPQISTASIGVGATQDDNINNLVSSTAGVSNSSETSNSNANFSSYRSEAVRLQSFATWPKSHIVSPSLLAKSGFFYLLDGDWVQCAFCSGKVHGWEHGDNPDAEHRRHFPCCPSHHIVASESVPFNNIAVSHDNVNQTQVTNEVGEQDEIRPFSHPERDAPSHPFSEATHSNLNDLGIHTHRGPKHPKYSTIESRLRTFVNWPETVSQTPQQLAQAGFYYAGANDQVRCFHCDGGLRQWDANDDPWVEHARWFSRCTYVMLVKGDEFIQNSIAQHPPIVPAQQSQRTVSNSSRSIHEEGASRTHVISDEDLDGLMTTPQVRAALEVGLDLNRIREALRCKLERTGFPYTSSDALIEAVLDLPSDIASSVPTRRNAPFTEQEGSNPAVSEDIRVRNHGSLNVSKSLPSIAGCQSEPTLQGQDVKTQSMPRLPREKSCKKLLESESSLEEENRRLKEARLCKICMDEEVGAVFVPCGHLATCVNCAASVQDCPMCRQPIKATVRTFLS